MAIVKNGFRGPHGDLSPGGITSGEAEDDELRSRSTTGSESSEGEEEEGSDADSGMGSDVYELSEMGEAGTEFCQVDNRSFCIPLELYDLPDLRHVLSLEAWNELLSEDERLALAEHLPDMDHETFARNLAELLSGANFHFGTPLADLFMRLKGGLCEPLIVLSRCASSLLQKRQHYHFLRRYQNSMVGKLFRIRNAWQCCKGYTIEAKLQVLNSLKSQQMLLGLKHDRNLECETNSDSEDSGERFWSKKFKMGCRALRPSKPVRHGSGAAYKENPKGLLKAVAPKGSGKKGYAELVDVRPKPSGQLFVHPRHKQVYRYDEADDNDEFNHGGRMGVQDNWNAAHGSTMAKGSLLKSGRKREFLKRYDREDLDRHAVLPLSLGKNRKFDKSVTKASYGCPAKNTKYSEKEQSCPKDRIQGLQVDWSDTSPTLRLSKMHGEAIPLDQQAKFDHWNSRGKKLKAGGEFSAGKSKFGSDCKAKPYQMFASKTDDSYIEFDRAKTSGEKIKSKYGRNGGMGMGYLKRGSAIAQTEEAESDSPDEVDEDGDVILMPRKLRFPINASEGRQSRVAKSVYNHKKTSKLPRKGSQVSFQHVGGDGSNGTPETGSYALKGKHKGTIHEPNYLVDHSFVNKGQLSDKLKPPAVKNYFAEKKRKVTIDPDQSNCLPDYGSNLVDGELDLDGSSRLVDPQVNTRTFSDRMQVADAGTLESDRHPKPNAPLTACNTFTKKRKGKLDGVYVDDQDESVYVQSNPMKQSDVPNLLKKKLKKNIDAVAGSLAAETPDQVAEKGTADTEPEKKTQKKPFRLIVPTVHSGFSFSIIHLLSAVRKALITPDMEDTTEAGSCLEKDEGRVKLKGEESNKSLPAVNCTDASLSHNMDTNPSEHAEDKKLPSLTVKEIVNRVRSSPGDPHILETQEPLQDLVRGVLKILSSRTAPLGAKSWKVLVSYEKSNKSWSWAGSVSSQSSDNDTTEEEISSEAWGISLKMLVKLVDAFAIWLKNGQETLRQIGSLPPPPVMAPVLDEKERFRDLRAQKSLNTIGPSSDQIRLYFRKEEFLRYSIPDRAFSYTAVDGKKSIVAPLRRGGGKPTSKARDHFMLKPDRPPHVTILCLVRDAAARLPGNIGTRADVCTLIRDSQYIVEDVADAQVNQVVSGALDRLHYERDPCVQFDGERKLWVYLHRDREEEDFEDDGTSSTKKWKRPRKGPTENSDVGAVNDITAGDPAAGGSAGYDFNPDLNLDMGERAELVYND